MPYTLTEHGDFQRRLEICKTRPVSRIHAWHRYFGKLIPAIPAAAIETYALPGLPVLDLFAGSGTTLVEAKLHGLDAAGLDISPIASFIQKVKTTWIDPILLEKAAVMLRADADAPHPAAPPDKLPFCVHRDNWFNPQVQEDLYWLRDDILCLFLRHPELPQDAAKDVQDLLLLCLSSIIRLVSNADPQHIFPGYSKRLRALDAAGKRKVNVRRSYFASLHKKIASMADYAPSCCRIAETKIISGDASQPLPLTMKTGLIVVNPPYISSVRYIETMKLELYWMGFLQSSSEYRALEKQMTGNDRLSRKELASPQSTGQAEIDALIQEFWAEDHSAGTVLANYFRDMDGAVSNMARLLPSDGHVVMKISGSRMKNRRIETARILTDLAEERGFICEEAFLDPIGRRSLLTARNTYSDLITHDCILVWRRL